MKVKILAGFYHEGRLVSPGDVLVMEDDDAESAIGLKRAIALGPRDGRVNGEPAGQGVPWIRRHEA